MVKASWTGGPSTKLKVSLYALAKKSMRAESVFRRGVAGGGRFSPG